MAFLAEGKDCIDIDVTGEEPIRVAVTPELFDSKVTCEPVDRVEEKVEPGSEVKEVEDDEEDEEEENGEGPDAGAPF